MCYRLHFLGTTGLTPAFCVTITAGHGPSCLGSLGERIQFWKETGCGWDLGLGRRPRLLWGAHGWLWCQPTCHREVPTSSTELGLQPLSSQEPQGGRQGLCTSGTLEQLRESKEKEEEEGQQPRIISAVTVCPRLCSGPWV